jgi:hypothetical protein
LRTELWLVTNWKDDDTAVLNLLGKCEGNAQWNKHCPK